MHGLARAGGASQSSTGRGEARVDVESQLAVLSAKLSQLTLCLHSIQSGAGVAGGISGGANPFVSLAVQPPPENDIG